MKNRIIFENVRTRVYINQCFKVKGVKTSRYAVRRDDENSKCDFLGEIKYSRNWRQYIFFPSKFTYWNHICLDRISDFLKEINEKRRKRWKKSK